MGLFPSKSPPPSGHDPGKHTHTSPSRTPPPPGPTPPPPSPTPPPPTSTPPTPTTTPIPDPPGSTENPAAEPSLSTDSVSPPASAENTSTGTTAAEAPPVQSFLVNGSSDASPVSGSQIESVSLTGSDSMFRTKDGESNDAPTLTPFSAPFQPLSTIPSNSLGVDLPNGVLSANGPSAPFATSIDGGPPASPHNPAAIILGVLVPLFAILIAAAGYIGYRRHKRLRDRRAWERTHEEIAVAVRDARPSIQPWVRFPDTPGASERGGETPAPGGEAPAPERNSVYSGIEQESSFDGTSLYTDHDRKQ